MLVEEAPALGLSLAGRARAAFVGRARFYFSCCQRLDCESQVAQATHSPVTSSSWRCSCLVSEESVLFPAKSSLLLPGCWGTLCSTAPKQCWC